MSASVASEAELLSMVRADLWAAWALSSDEIGSTAAAVLLAKGMLVAPGGAAELERLRSRVVELEAAVPAELTVYRAEHESIVFGLYTTAQAAREHCEALMHREQPDADLDWIEDEEDGVAELVAATPDGAEVETGYVVTALAVASAYDPDGDE